MKKVINVFVLTVLLLEQTHANDLKDMVNSASVRSSEWQSPATGSKYFYSGSYEFTFKKSNSYAPWINVGGGDGTLFKAGCNGFSMGDMFVSMLNLNDIKDQLSDAGAQLAWGVMIGMISSMPIIKETFASIQKWARAIQDLLQNACAIGQNLSKGSVFGPLTNAISGATTDVGKKIHEADKGIAGFIDSSTTWIDSLDTTHDSNATKKAKDGEKGSAAKKIIALLKGTNGRTARQIAGEFTSSSLPKASSKNALFIGDMDTFLEDGQIGGKTFISNSSARTALKTRVLLNLIFVGDVALSKVGLEMITDVCDCTGGTCKINPTKIAKAAVEHVASGDKGKDDKAFVVLAPIINNPTKAADAIVNGFTEESSSNKDSSGNSLSGDGYCKVYNYKIALGDFTYTAKPVTSSDGNTTGSPSKKTVRFLSLISSKVTSSSLKLEWEGALKESYKLIKYKVQQKSGITGNLGLFEGEPITASPSTIIPVVIPGASKYFDIIASIEKKDRQETGYTASLKELLAQYNAYLFSKSFFNSLLAKIESSMKDSNIGGGRLAELKRERDDLLKTKEAVQKQFHKIVEETNDFKTIVEIFQQIEKNQRIERSNKLR